MRGGKRTLLDKVMPQDAGGIFKYANVHGDIGTFFFDSWTEVTFLDVEQFAQLAKASETPIALLGDETMVGILWRRGIGSGMKEGRVRLTADGVYCGVMDI